MAENKLCNTVTLYNGHGQLKSVTVTEIRKPRCLKESVLRTETDYKHFLSLVLSTVLY